MDRLKCERALEIAWTASVTDAPETPEVREARRHLAECLPCREYLRRDEVLADRLRDLRLCGATPCPDSVREAVRASLDREAGTAAGVGAVGAADRGAPDIAPGDSSASVGTGRSWPAWIEGAAATAAAIVLIGGGLFLSQELNSAVPDQAFVADFRRSALPEITGEIVPKSEVRAFYRAQFGGDGPALMLDAPVRKVAVCNLDGRRAAMVEYEISGQRLVFYQVPREEAGPEANVRTGREGDLHVARWGDAQYDYALISEMSGEMLKQLARRTGI